MMNRNARAFLASMERALVSLPDATAIGLCIGALHPWKHLEIHAASDDAVRALGLSLGLGEPASVRADRHQWLRAELSVRQTRIVVIGPPQLSCEDSVAPRSSSCGPSVDGQPSRREPLLQSPAGHPQEPCRAVD